MVIKLRLCDTDRCDEIVVWQRGIKNFMTMIDEVSWFPATRNRIPTTEEEDFHSILMSRDPLESLSEVSGPIQRKSMKM